MKKILTALLTIVSCTQQLNAKQNFNNVFYMENHKEKSEYFPENLPCKEIEIATMQKSFQDFVKDSLTTISLVSKDKDYAIENLSSSIYKVQQDLATLNIETISLQIANTLHDNNHLSSTQFDDLKEDGLFTRNNFKLTNTDDDLLLSENYIDDYYQSDDNIKNSPLICLFNQKNSIDLKQESLTNKDLCPMSQPVQEPKKFTLKATIIIPYQGPNHPTLKAKNLGFDAYDTLNDNHLF